MAVKTIPASFDSSSDGSALRGHHAWPNGFKKQAQCIQVGGQWTLHVGLSCKHNKAEAVASSIGCQALNGPFGQVEARHADVLGHHAVADVQRHHHVDTFGFDLLKAAAHFWVKPRHEKCSQGQSKKEVFPRWQENAIARKNAFDAACVGECLHCFLSPSQMTNHDQCHQRRQRKQRHEVHAMQGQTRDKRFGDKPSCEQPRPRQELQKQEHANGWPK